MVLHFHIPKLNQKMQYQFELDVHQVQSRKEVHLNQKTRFGYNERRWFANCFWEPRYVGADVLAYIQGMTDRRSRDLSGDLYFVIARWSPIFTSKNDRKVIAIAKFDDRDL